MKTDPDFHPLAAKWLDSQATAPEQAVLQDILSADATAMEEFARLCQTETLLRQAPQDPASCRAALESLLAGKPWPARAVAFWRHPNRRHTAAAAVLGLGFWVVWLLGERMGHDPSALTKNSPSLPALRIPGNPGGKSAGSSSEAEDGSNIDPELRRLLERMPVIDFKAQGSLSECVAAHFHAIEGADGKMIPVEVADEGDAPVFLEFQALMPTWHLLHLMALQTGTVLGTEDGALVFRRAQKPESLEDHITRSANLNNLRALLVLREMNQEGDMPAKYAGLVEQALGSGITFEADSEKSVSISGSSRDVKVLKAALTAALAFPVKTNLSVAMITVPAYVYAKAYSKPDGSPPSEDAPSLNVNPLDNPGPAVIAEILKHSPQPTLSGVFTAEQCRLILPSMLQRKGFQFKALMEQPVTANQENVAASVETMPDGNCVTGEASVIIRAADKTITVDATTLMNIVAPQGLQEDYAGINYQVMIWSGQTPLFGDFRKPDGSAVKFFITASDSDDAPAPGQSGGSEATPAAPQPASGELPAIPVPGKPGFVTSPYAEGTPVELDVSRLKHGSAFTCPLTGRKFRIP